MDTLLAMGAFLSASLLGYLISRTIHRRYVLTRLVFMYLEKASSVFKTETMLQLRRKSVVTQRQWLVPAGKGRPMHGRAEFLSRPGGGGLWNSAWTVPSYTGSPSNGII